jgi:hypothetical protein
MDSGTYKYTFFGNSFQTFRIFIFTSNSQIFTSITGKSSTERTSMEEVGAVAIFFNFT